MLLPGGAVQNVALLALAAWLVIYGLVLARRVIVAYRRAVRIFDDTHADDIGAYIEWLSTFTYWALIFGVGCGLLTFLPDKYVYIWVFSSILFYSYLFHCYQNYLLFYEQVENAFEQDIQSEEELLTNSGTEPEMVSEEEVPVSYTEIIEKVANWIKTDGYVQQGLTIKGLSEILHTNRTYLSAYIKTTYKMTFREWITGLRLEYAKNILKEHPEINIQKLAESSGFLSRSNFIKSFTEKEGCTPGKWKATVRLLGVTGAEQLLTGEIRYTDGNPPPTMLKSNLTEALKEFNTGKGESLTLGGTLVETPEGMEVDGAEINGWGEVKGDDVNADL